MIPTLNPADERPDLYRLRANIDGLCVPGVLSAVVQPLVALADLRIVGYEALTRVPAVPPRAPDWWLERAQEIRMRERLEIACWRAIIELGPVPDGALLFVNISPSTLAEPDLLALLGQMPDRTVIEITEQQAVADYATVQSDLLPWLAGNFRLAIDDAGAGHSSLRHVIELVPDYVKIDRSLISGIDSDRNRTALLRSLVTFAHEVGITVIAEGVETLGELEVVRDAGADLGQGYVFARPERIRQGAWPQLAAASDSALRASIESESSARVVHAERENERLRRSLDRAETAKGACDAVVESLYRQGQLLPSLYLEFEGQLRCVSQRGLWQVLDGMSGDTGITGRTWATGAAIVASDVRHSADYLEAIPGVISEICVPILCDGVTIGALNVESLTTLSVDTLADLQRCAELLASRLKIVGWKRHGANWRAAGRASVAMSRLTFEYNTPDRAIEILREVAEMDSACLIRHAEGSSEVVSATGPLSHLLATLPVDEIAALAHLVDHVSSCYTANESTGRAFNGTDSIREHARAVIVMPLRSGGVRTGTVVLANSRPRALSSEDVEPLELIAGHMAAALDAAAQLEQLRDLVSRDQLTGIGNRTALERGLREVESQQHVTKHAALILDCDHFKLLNDRYGHLAGDSALCLVARTLESHRPDVQVFRYGGDEFVCLLPYAENADALEVATSILDRASAALAPLGASVSAGLALPTATELPWATLARADDALLEAKRGFRGQVILSAVS